MHRENAEADAKTRVKKKKGSANYISQIHNML